MSKIADDINRVKVGADGEMPYIVYPEEHVISQLKAEH